jgi:hypothetical protein
VGVRGKDEDEEGYWNESVEQGDGESLRELERKRQQGDG